MKFLKLQLTKRWQIFVLIFLKTAKKTKKVTVSKSLGGKENEKKKRKSAVEKERELDVSAQHDELMITQILGDSQTKTVPPHPHFGGKQPKQHPLPKCISVVCREEKDSLEQEILDIHDELNDTRRELEKAKEELSKCSPCHTSFILQAVALDPTVAHTFSHKLICLLQTHC